MEKFKKEDLFYKYSKQSIILMYSVIIVILAIICYFTIPIVLNYPPNFINSDFDVAVSGIPYWQQFIIIISAIIIIEYIMLSKILKDFNKCDILLKKTDKDSIKKINAIRKKCFNLPYLIYIGEVCIPIFITTTVMLLLALGRSFMISTKIMLVLKIGVFIFSFITTIAIISLIFSKKLFSKILIRTYIGTNDSGFRIDLKKRILSQILPMFFVSILLTSLIGYSRLIDEKSNLIFKVLHTQLEEKFDNLIINDVNTAYEVLKKIRLEGVNISPFVVTQDNKIFPNNIKFNGFFLKYMKEVSPKINGRVFDATGEIQGATLIIKGAQGNLIVGIKYEVVSYTAIEYFVVGFIFLFIICLFVIYYFSKSFSEDIAIVTQNLIEITKQEEVDLSKQLPITSNDEIGDLVIAFNELQQYEKMQIEQIKQTQEVLTKQDRLAVLGQLAGGIAHDINNPANAVQTGLFKFKTSIKKIKLAQTKEEIFDIVNGLTEVLDNCDNANRRVLEIAASVKNHTRNLSKQIILNFDIKQFIEKEMFMLEHLFKKNNCKFEIIEKDILKINSDPGKLSQVILNLVSNAIQAYEQKPGIIQIIIYKNNNNAVIAIKDFAGGIPKHIEKGVFEKILTTKDINGTGLGLFISHSIVTGNLSGKIWFDTVENEGTTFFIELPIEIK